MRRHWGRGVKGSVVAINNAMLCRGRRTVDGGWVQVQKYSSGGLRSEGLGGKAK